MSVIAEGQCTLTYDALAWDIAMPTCALKDRNSHRAGQRDLVKSQSDCVILLLKTPHGSHLTRLKAKVLSMVHRSCVVWLLSPQVCYPITLFSTDSPSATLASLLFLELAGHSPALLFSLPWILFSQIATWLFPSLPVGFAQTHPCVIFLHTLSASEMYCSSLVYCWSPLARM